MKFIDLFCGLGGIRLGVQSVFTDSECVFSSDIDKFAKKTYYDNFNESPSGDITKIKEEDIPSHDLLVAGFPCQSFSIAGLRKGFEETRGTLFFEIARIVKFHQPKVVFLENVRGILSHEKGKTFKIIVETLKDLGYKVNYKVLNSSNFGVPQSRDRVYIVCTRNDLNIDFTFPKGILNTVKIKDILEETVDEKLTFNIEDIVVKTTNMKFSDYVEVIPQKTTKPFRLFHFKKGRQGSRVYSIHSIGITALASPGGGGSSSGLFLVDGKIRRLSVTEVSKLQGFPSNYIFSSSVLQTRKQLGNSVTVPVITAIMEQIKNANIL
jgi:DNA (cytosine-5)-methyltransferase 1